MVFVWWTAANLVPRADAIYRRYREEFGCEALKTKKRIIPLYILRVRLRILVHTLKDEQIS